MQVSSSPPRELLIFVLIVGLALSVLAAYFWFDTRKFLDGAAHSEGVVVAVREGVPTQLWTFVAFKTANGRQVEFRSKRPDSVSPRFPIGTRVDVLYDPRDPANARINSLIDIWGLTIAFSALGVVFLGLGIAVSLLGLGILRRNSM